MKSRLLIAAAALVACSLTSVASETVLKNMDGVVVGKFSCSEKWGNCLISGEYLGLEITDAGLIVIYKATFPSGSDVKPGAVFAYPKIWGDCIHVVTDLGDATFFINRATRIGSSNRSVCGTDGYY